MNTIDLPFLLALFFVFMLLVLLSIYFIVKGVMKMERQKKTGQTATSGQTEMDFMVTTFHGLVHKLKENEKELTRLKAQAENRADETEQYNEHIVQSVSSGVITLDNTMNIRSINLSAQTTLNLKEEDALNKSYSDIFTSSFSDFLGKKESISRAECAYIRDDGKKLWLGLTTSPLKDKEGRVLGVVVVFTDLTEIKELQLKIEARERLTHLGEMSAGIAHELRNPMAVVAGYAKILKKKVEPSLIPTVVSIIQEINVMDKIISQFLVFAKPTELNLSQVNISELLIEESDRIKSNDIGVTLELDENIAVMGDEVLLKQAFNNLIGNASEAMPEGGHLIISSDTGAQGDIQIRIRDTGSGMTEEIIEKVFLPFYTTKQSGTGLGLALVQKIIISHGGSISVDSEEGKGTIFTIKFPAMMDK